MQKTKKAFQCMMFAILLYGFHTGASWGSFQDGNSLYETCQDEHGVNLGACFGYIEGLTDAMTGAGGLNGLKACFPDGVSSTQTVNVVKLYLQLNPQKRNYTAASLIASALAQTFPCK